MLKSFILGENVESAARSPYIWNKLYKLTSQNAAMTAINTNKLQFIEHLNRIIAEENFRAVLFAAPLKEMAYQFSIVNKYEIKANLESINLIFESNGYYHGVSTDGYGAIRSLNLSDEQRNILILGYGGTSKSIVHAMLEAFKNLKILIASRSSVTEDDNIKIIRYPVPKELLKTADVIINATVLGSAKYPNMSPLSVDEMAEVNKKCLVFDVNYNSSGETEFTKIARNFSLNTLDGKEMNLMQALYAFKISNPECHLSIDKLKLLINV